MQPCIAPANPDDHGRPINYAPKYAFVRPVTPEQREAADLNRELLIQHSKKLLGIFENDCGE